MPHSPLEGTFIFARRQFGLKIFCYILTGIQMIFDIATHKTCNRKISSSSLPYTWLQCCYSFTAGLQPHPGSRGCSNTCVTTFCILSPLTSLSHTRADAFYIFLLYIQRLRQEKESLTIMKLLKCNLGKISDLTLHVCLWPLQRGNRAVCPLNRSLNKNC